MSISCVTYKGNELLESNGSTSGNIYFHYGEHVSVLETFLIAYKNRVTQQMLCFHFCFFRRETIRHSELSN